MSRIHYNMMDPNIVSEKLITDIHAGRTEFDKAMRDCSGLFEAYCRYFNAANLTEKYNQKRYGCPLYLLRLTKSGRRLIKKRKAMHKIAMKRKEEYQFIKKLYT